MNYEPNPAPGLFEHRGGSCDYHGDNVVFARPKGTQIKHECVACMLEVCEILKRQDEQGKIR